MIDATLYSPKRISPPLEPLIAWLMQRDLPWEFHSSHYACIRWDHTGIAIGIPLDRLNNRFIVSVQTDSMITEDACYETLCLEYHHALEKTPYDFEGDATQRWQTANDVLEYVDRLCAHAKEKKYSAD